MDTAANTAPYMGIISWIILGLIAGFIGSKIVNRTGEGIVLDIVLGVVGAVIGGYLFNLFGAHGVTGLNLWSLAGRGDRSDRRARGLQDDRRRRATGASGLPSLNPAIEFERLAFAGRPTYQPTGV